ncbi:hypothetical protein N9Z02_01605 [Akkermansiaceae bacterium]|nr:hypothetical protein [Akkermansiaceae bacterium]
MKYIIIALLLVSVSQGAEPPVKWIHFVSAVYESENFISQSAEKDSGTPAEMDGILAKVEKAISELVKSGDLVEREIRLKNMDDENGAKFGGYFGKLGAKYGSPVAREMIGIGVGFLMKNGEKFNKDPNGIVLKIRLSKSDLKDFEKISGDFSENVKSK